MRPHGVLGVAPRRVPEGECAEGGRRSALEPLGDARGPYAEFRIMVAEDEEACARLVEDPAEGGAPIDLTPGRGGRLHPGGWSTGGRPARSIPAMNTTSRTARVAEALARSYSVIDDTRDDSPELNAALDALEAGEEYATASARWLLLPSYAAVLASLVGGAYVALMGGPAFALAGIAVALAGGWFGWLGIRRFRPHRGLVLTAAGLRFERGEQRTLVPWAEVGESYPWGSAVTCVPLADVDLAWALVGPGELRRGVDGRPRVRAGTRLLMRLNTRMGAEGVQFGKVDTPFTPTGLAVLVNACRARFA